MSKNTILYTVIALIGVIALVALINPTPLGGLVHTTFEHFVQGISLGSGNIVGCTRVRDTDKAGWSYITYLNGVATATGGASGAFNIPDACLNR
uniref:Uncharacterized protein n=1 Tax=viral metagenome TaxID=1070528 RepID=A0A6H1ZFT5_9ZZZZ